MRTEINDDLGTIERIAESLERRGDLISLNEHLFDSMWAYWRAARFSDCVACCERATTLAARLGIPPVQYGTLKSFALLELGLFDDAWAALEEEVADDAHPFGRAFQHLGRTWWYATAGDHERVLAEVPRVFAEAKALQRIWMLPWAEGMLASAVIAKQPDGTSEEILRAEIVAAGGRLADEALIAAQLRAGNAAAALVSCSERVTQLPTLRVRSRWLVEEMKARALLALGRFTEVRDAADAALAAAASLDWRQLEWRVRGLRSSALAGLGDSQAGEERRLARSKMMEVAKTLTEPRLQGKFLSQPAAVILMA
jgi:hypothetical protein